jgi:hypothetical protein
MSYQLVTKRSFDKEFAALPKDIQRRVADAFLAARRSVPARLREAQGHSQLPYPCRRLSDHLLS